MVALLAGLLGGIERMGWVLPVDLSSLEAIHGPLMVSGFLGTVISLERAVAINRAWGYIAPFLTGVGSLLMISQISVINGAILITLGSLVLVAIFVYIIMKQGALFTFAMGVAAVLWVIGNILWVLGTPFSLVSLWWISFLALTIAGERLELARLQEMSGGSIAIFLLIALFLIKGSFLVSRGYDWAYFLFGFAILALSFWFLKNDIARRTVRQTGLTRFIAVSLLTGYVWLGISGILIVFFRSGMSGPSYDAVLHSFFLGFIFAMIFGHAPIIFPAVLDITMYYRPVLYLHLLLLELTLALRVISDLVSWQQGIQIGGLLNFFTILIFLANTVYSLKKTNQSVAI